MAKPKPEPISKQPPPPKEKPLPPTEWPRYGDGIGFGKGRTTDTF